MAHFFIATNYRGKSIADYFFILADELVRRRHRVTFLLAGRRFDVVNGESNPAIQTWPSVRPTNWQDALYLGRLISEHRPDCIIANFSSVNMSILTGCAMGVPHRIAWYHTLSSQQRLDSDRQPWIDAALRFRKRFVYRLATHVIANTKAALGDIRAVYKLPSEKSSSLPYLIPDPREHVFGGIPREQSKVICVGRLDYSKGQATLLRAVPEIRKSHPNLEVEFVGDGPARDEYQTLSRTLGLANCCRFLGRLELREVFALMASAAVCVAPSLSEALGLVNIEAQALETPVVASAVDGIPEVVQDGKTGFLVPPNEPDALANRINILLGDSRLRRAFGETGRNYFLNSFSSRNAGAHVDHLEQLVCDA